MKEFEIIMPKLGESITEATIIKWFVKEGDTVEEDDVLLEIATDKVDSEIPSPVEGVVKKIFFKQDEIVKVGTAIAIIDMAGEGAEPAPLTERPEQIEGVNEKEAPSVPVGKTRAEEYGKPDTRFYSPLVKRIAAEENISPGELASLQGTGINGRVRKNDILTYVESSRSAAAVGKPSSVHRETVIPTKDVKEKDKLAVNEGDTIIEMDRMRKLIAEHMIRSKQVSAHVTNMLEVDVTNIVNWRNKIKDEFERREGQKITYLPVFIETAIKALKDFPMINSSVDGERIIIRKRINMGIAVSLQDNNLIVPVIKDADTLNLAGLTKELNRLANNARANKLKPDDIQDGTFTITNFGSFRNTIGTPIINQPQVAILAIGTIEKKPAVLETPDGDVIAIRHKMFLALTYDHRIIDGALGGAWLRKMGDYIETFDINRII